MEGGCWSTGGAGMQVMALIAHLMEEKNNFGPHLIVVPNAVLVNWRSELHAWLPGTPPLPAHVPTPATNAWSPCIPV